jgi:MFS family permease
MVPLVVDAGHLPSANSLMGVARWGSFIVGPSLAAFLYQGAGSAWVFALDALTFVLSATLMVRARPRFARPSERQGTFREIVEGGRYVAGVNVALGHDHAVRGCADAPACAAAGADAAAHPGPLRPRRRRLRPADDARRRRNRGRTLLFGQLQPRRRRGVLTYALFLVNSLAIAAMALSPSYALAGSMCVVRGLCIGFGVAAWETMLQELVPEQLLARVVSLDFFGSFGLMPVGLAIWGALAGIAAPGRRSRSARSSRRG